jgi:two-component system nitrogen regulation response regulator NtrX
MGLDVLIVDDEDDIRFMISGILEDEGYSTRQATNSDEAIKAVEEKEPDLVVLDIWLEGSNLDGIEVLKKIKKLHPSIPVVMISGHGNVETAVSAIKVGAYDFIEKPFKTDRLLLIIERAIEASQLRKENLQLKNQATNVEELLGDSVAISNVRQLIERVSPTGSRVLITGNAGVGKEVVAKLIHRKSKRYKGPLVVVNCAAMHPERMEFELFGEETSDGEIKAGTFEQANKGTLLLDEVADMPLETQGKIVRVLQEQTFSRVGGGEKISVNVRVIATSNKDIQAMISEGKFREDLYYRLNVVPISVPPLKERREDIPRLAEYFMEKAAKSAGQLPRSFSSDALALLQTYSWPGNVRQLRNMMDWIIIMSSSEAGNLIEKEELPPEISSGTPKVMHVDRFNEYLGLSLREAREIFEKEYLQAMLVRCGENISETARQVGMERSALHRKLKSLNVNS